MKKQEPKWKYEDALLDGKISSRRLARLFYKGEKQVLGDRQALREEGKIKWNKCRRGFNNPSAEDADLLKTAIRDFCNRNAIPFEEYFADLLNEHSESSIIKQRWTPRYRSHSTQNLHRAWLRKAGLLKCKYIERRAKPKLDPPSQPPLDAPA